MKDTVLDHAEALAKALEPSRIWFDTEFIEDGKTIDLISIGLVRSDGATYYAECAEADHSRADDWARANVLVHLTGDTKPRAQIAREIIEFAGPKPEFWAYYADYDWVALCQLYGRMIDLPKGWPMFCRDLKQLAVDAGNPELPDQDGDEHHALADAAWNRHVHDYLDTHTALAAYRSELERERNGASLIIAELVALVPLKDTLAASKTGSSLIAYFKAVLTRADLAEARATVAEAAIARLRDEVVEVERERDHYKNGLQTLASTFYKEDQHQDYAKHIMDTTLRALNRDTHHETR